MSPTQGQADIIGSNSIPAISQPLWGQLYGWLPLSNAYGISSSEKQPISIILQLFLALENKAHPMYIGISSGATQPISIILRHFLALQNKTRLMSIGISSIVKKTLLFGKIDCEAIQAL